MVYLNGFFCRDTLSNAENNGATSTGLLLVTLFIRLYVSSEPCYDLHHIQQVNNLFSQSLIFNLVLWNIVQTLKPTRCGVPWLFEFSL